MVGVNSNEFDYRTSRGSHRNTFIVYVLPEF